MSLPPDADWAYIARMLEMIRNFQTEEALALQLELRHLSSELKNVRLCQDKLLEAHLGVGLNGPSSSEKGICCIKEGESYTRTKSVGDEKTEWKFHPEKNDTPCSNIDGIEKSRLTDHSMKRSIDLDSSSTNERKQSDVEVGILELRTLLIFKLTLLHFNHFEYCDLIYLFS
jgi:hypothetical protein